MTRFGVLAPVALDGDSTGVTTRLIDVCHYADRSLIARTALFKSPAASCP